MLELIIAFASFLGIWMFSWFFTLITHRACLKDTDPVTCCGLCGFIIAMASMLIL